MPKKEKYPGDTKFIESRGGTTRTTPEDDLLQALAEEDREKFLDELAQVISDRERMLLAAIRADMKPRDWARTQGVANGTIDKMMHRIRKKARKLIGRTEFDGL